MVHSWCSINYIECVGNKLVTNTNYFLISVQYERWNNIAHILQWHRTIDLNTCAIISSRNLNSRIRHLSSYLKQLWASYIYLPLSSWFRRTTPWCRLASRVALERGGRRARCRSCSEAEVGDSLLRRQPERLHHFGIQNVPLIYKYNNSV